MVRRLGHALAAIGCLFLMGGVQGDTGKADTPRVTLWLGSSTMVQFATNPEGTLSIGLGIASVVKSRSEWLSFTQAGFAVEAIHYPRGDIAGLGFGLRVGNAVSSYVAPGIFYVARPKGNIMGRFGALAPIGTDIHPFLPEIAIGIQF